MKITLTRAALARKYKGCLAVTAKPCRQPDPIRNAELRTQMIDHPADRVLPAPEMEAALPALAVAVRAALPLFEQPGQGHPPAGEDPQVAMQRQYPFIRTHRQGSPHRNGLLADPAE